MGRHVHNVAAVLDQLLERDRLATAVVVPVPHEVFAEDTVFVLVVLDRSVLPDSVNHGLPVFFLNNQIREVAYKVTELTVCKPQHFLVRPCGVEHLKGDVLALYIAAKVTEDVIR